jgi:hypothetical protein
LTYLDVLLEILGTLEALSTKVALVRLERDVDANVRGDVVALDGGGPARVPLARQVEIVGALAPNVFLADMFLSLWSDQLYFLNGLCDDACL